MEVGVNYPWVNYGWDFGLGPPQWRGTETSPAWYEQIDQHLQLFSMLGISVVRWFILADGLTYGIGGDAPRPDPTPGKGWRFDPPPLGPEFLEHFEELLIRFVNFNRDAARPIRLLPVLIDFHFCEPGNMPIIKPDPVNEHHTIPDPDWVKQGRADVITDTNKRRRFLDQALDPLLRVSQAHREVIYAWELINEPEWITNTWHPDHKLNHPITAPSMRAFLNEGKARIRRAGLKSTIGFASFDTLRRSRITAEINQFHHYANGVRTLKRHPFNARYPCIIGEFATASTDIWPELTRTGQSVLNRLKLAAVQGYPLAIPWSFLAMDRHTSWSLTIQHDLEYFSQGKTASNG
ncbi:MAG: hypothetical protein U0V70_07875 [Terriglobia bacterium]